MCGLVGILSSDKIVSPSTDKIFKDLLFLDTYRGADSTGVFLVPTKWPNETKLMKKVMPGTDFIHHKPFLNLLSAHDYSLYMGHNRLATKGSVTIGNAHPFELYDSKQDRSIILMHNGTVYNKHELIAGDKFDTDSEAICNSILMGGVEETLEKIDGAFALVWYDTADKTVNFVRNDKRTFGFAWDKYIKRLFFASDTKMLEIAMERHKVSVDRVEQLATGKWIKYSLYNASEPLSTKEVKFRSETSTKFLGYGHYNNYPPKKGITQVWNNRTGRYEDVQTTKEKTSKEKSPTEAKIITTDLMLEYKKYSNKKLRFTITDFVKTHMRSNTQYYEAVGLAEDAPFHYVFALLTEKQKMAFEEFDTVEGVVCGYRTKNQKNIELCAKNVVFLERNSFIETYTGPKGQIGKKEFNTLTKEGCANCTCNIFPGDHLTISWTHDNQPVCQACTAKLMDDKASLVLSQ